MKTLLSLFLALIASAAVAQFSIKDYLGDGHRFNDQIPEPAEVIGHEIGEYHISYDKLIRYMEVLAESSDRVSLEIIGYSHELRPLMNVIITDPENHSRLDKIRQDHLASIDPEANKNLVRDEYLIVQLGYSVHGNEPSGVNAAPLIAYYLAAGEDNLINEMLKKSVIIIEPGLNPDGIDRFASWVNSRRSLHNNPDLNSIEFSEPWPGSRSNHYWYDLNRDWLFLQHPESQARIQAFHRWLPHVLTDHHEMGSSSTFFFQPGVKSRNNPLIPESNYALTQRIGTYHARALDEIGSLYWTEDTFDDFYFGKGSAYPDLNGGIGILFEQASSRGHLRESPYGELSFPFTIRNQVRVSLSTLQASWDLRKELQFHQENFYTSALEEAEAALVKGYLFTCPQDPMRTRMMIELLLQHQIRVEPLNQDIQVNGNTYPASSSFLIRSKQPHYRTIRTLMERMTAFADSTFYDISTWNLPLAMGAQYDELEAKDISRIRTGKALSAAPGISGQMETEPAQQAYVFEWHPYLSPKALYQILSAGLLAKVANQPFTVSTDRGENRSYDYGAILIPVERQALDSRELSALLYNLAIENGLDIRGIQSAYTTAGPDLGSSNFSFLQLPRVLMMTGGSVSSREAGQIWHLFDTRFTIPVTLADVNDFGQIDLNRYNTLILPGGSYREWNQNETDQLKEWIRSGGKVIALKSANDFLKRAGLIQFDYKQGGDYPQPDTKFQPYALRRAAYTGRSIPGSQFEAHLDLTHPLGYGYTSSRISLFKNSTSFIEPSSTPWENPLYYTREPRLSGYINEQNLEGLKESVVVQSYRAGRGRIISFFDDPFFRAYFAGQHKLFFNALYFDF